MESSLGQPGKPNGTPDTKRSLTTLRYSRRAVRRRGRNIFERRVRTPIDREHGTGQRLGVALHFSRERAHLRRVREEPSLVRDYADRHRHQWYSMKLAAAILAEEISGAPVLLRV